MNYWPSISWKAVFSSSGGSESVDLKVPFALIGSHPSCNIRIKKKNYFPPLAYFAVAFEDSIEVWPLCAIAYPHWGILNSQQKLRLGRKYIRLVPTDDGPQSIPVTPMSERPAGDSNTVNVPTILEFDIGGKEGSLVLDRRVLILGNDHPSTRRIHGVGLSRCEYAIVTTHGRCWLINLRPKPKQSLHELVCELRVGGEKTQIGKIKASIRLSSEDEQTDLGGLSSHKGLSGRELQTGIDAPKTKPSQDRWTREARPVHETASETEVSPAKKTDIDPGDVDVSDIDEVTSNVTDRLVSISQSRWRHRPKVRAFLFTILFLLATWTILWITTQLIIPLVLDLEGL